MDKLHRPIHWNMKRRTPYMLPKIRAQNKALTQISYNVEIRAQNKALTQISCNVGTRTCNMCL